METNHFNNMEISPVDFTPPYSKFNAKLFLEIVIFLLFVKNFKYVKIFQKPLSVFLFFP